MVVLSQPLMYGLQTIKDRNEMNKNETSTYHSINCWLVPSVVINRLVICKQSRLVSKNVIQNFLAIYILWNLIHVVGDGCSYTKRELPITVLFMVCSNSRQKILTCLLLVTAIGLAIDHRFFESFPYVYCRQMVSDTPRKGWKVFL